MLGNDLLATITAFGVALIWLRLNDFAAQRGWLSEPCEPQTHPHGYRPIVRPVLASFHRQRRFPLFSGAGSFIDHRAVLPGGHRPDPGPGGGRSDVAQRRSPEILRGPLFYGIVFVALTMIYWKDSPIGILALMLMCGGDGLADVIGRRFGKSRLPWNAGKSWLGSLGMFFGGWLFSLGVLSAYLALGLFPGDLSGYLLPVTVIALAGTLVESLPSRISITSP